jgi:hypothetical protein
LQGLGEQSRLQLLDIFSCDHLQSLEGLTPPASMQRISLIENGALTTLRGLEGLEEVQTLTIGGIGNNPSLTSMGDFGVLRTANLGGPARLDPCPWTRDAECDETASDCASGTDVIDCVGALPFRATGSNGKAAP